MRRYLILGAGAAGVSAAEAIRSRDPHGQITLVYAEREGYYSRPGLAYYLTGEIPEKQLFPWRKQDFQRFQIHLREGRAAQILPDSHEVALVNGTHIAYDCLLIATGSSAIAPRVPGANLQGVVKLDSLHDTRLSIEAARRAKSAVVVGGGITALELAEGLRARGVKVHYFLRKDRYWSNVLDETESRIVEQRLQHEGITLHYNTDLAEILEKKGRVAAVRTADGREIACQAVGVAIGVRPNLDFAQKTGLKIEKGLLVNEYLQTNLPDIYAAGDVAQVFDPATGKAAMDVLWNTAREQGRIAGLNLTGAHMPYRKSVPFNVTRLAGLTTTIIGQVGSGRDADPDLMGIVRGDSETWRDLPDAIAAQRDFEINRLRLMVGERTLLGAIVMGDQTLSQPVYHLVRARADITPIREQLLAPNAPLADLLVDFWQHWRQNTNAHAKR